LSEIVNKIKEILADDKIPIYQDKVEVLNLLIILGHSLDSVADLVNKYYWNDVILTIDEACQDRVAKVQQAARIAKDVWTLLRTKGDKLAEHKKTEEIGPNTALTPDDLLKVQSGHGNVTDAKNLGYLKKRKTKFISNKRPNTGATAQDHLLEQKRSKSKLLNSSQNKIESKMMREKIFNMEKQRNSLLRQAEVFKKRDNSIDNLMDKYKVKSDKKSTSKTRGPLLPKIKERMMNIDKGKSIDIKESKLGKERRLQKERKVSDVISNNEGCESEKTSPQKRAKSEHKSNSVDEKSEGKSSKKEASPGKDQSSKGSRKGSNNERSQESLDKQDQDQNFFNEEEQHIGDEKINIHSAAPKQNKFNPDIDNFEGDGGAHINNESIPKDLKKDLIKVAKENKNDYGKI
jgi:hypothetical protein